MTNSTSNTEKLYLQDGTEFKSGTEVYWVGLGELHDTILDEYDIQLESSSDYYHKIHIQGNKDCMITTPSFGSLEALYKFCKEQFVYCEELYRKFE